MVQPKRPYRINWFKLLLLCVTGYFLYIIAGQQIELYKVRRQTAGARFQLEQAKRLNQELQEERNRLSTPAYVEKLAREQLGLVKPGEIPYIPAGN